MLEMRAVGAFLNAAALAGARLSIVVRLRRFRAVRRLMASGRVDAAWVEAA
jgi:hypothetical protein